MHVRTRLCLTDAVPAPPPTCGCSSHARRLPFFVDAALGALLDVVILLQFFLYRSADDDDEDEAAGDVKAQRSGSRKALLAGGVADAGRDDAVPADQDAAGSATSQYSVATV